jgi:hypothetical protein
MGVARLSGVFAVVAACCATGANSATAAVIASPSIVSNASGATTIGLEVSDHANLINGANPTGTLTFDLFGPDDATCSGVPLLSTATPVNGNGFYDSAPFTTSKAGTYRWVASYSGDSNNNPAGPTACTDPAESVSVSKFFAVVTTVASPGVAVGGTIHDTAKLGGFNPTGTITFRLSGPTDTTCAAAPVFTTTASVTAGNGNYPSPDFTPTVPGTYRWQASYGGDANNTVAPISACLDENESVVVTEGKVTPTVTTTASSPVAVGNTMIDTATLAGGNSPAGAITFNLFGPNDTNCATPTFTSVTAVNAGNGAYPSGAFAVSAVGVYRWTASYGGDAGNNPVTTACGDANETVTVTRANTTIVTHASGPATVGAPISDTATLSGAFSPTGTLTFDLFGPDDSTCTGSPAASSTKAVTGNASYQSALFSTMSPGTYRWVASYSGDANSNPAGPTACNDPAEAVVVTAATTTTTTSTSTTTTTIPEATTTSTSTTIPEATTTTTIPEATTTSTSTTIPEATTSTSTTIPEATTTTSTTIPEATTTTSTTIPEATTTTTIPEATTTSTSTTIPEATTTTSTSTTIPEATTTTSTSTTIPEATTTTTTTSSTTTTSTTTTTTGTTSTTVEGSGPTAQARPSVVPAGQTTLVSGSGFPGGSQLSLTLFSNPVLLATTTANALGDYQVTVTIPATTTPGTHTVVVSTTTGTIQARTTLTVTSPSSATTASTIPGALSFTGADVRGSSTVALILLVLGLVTLAGTRRRRPLP